MLSCFQFPMLTPSGPEHAPFSGEKPMALREVSGPRPHTLVTKA